MADQSTENILRQQQQQVQQQRTNLSSTRSLRAIEGIKGLLSRQKQTAQLTQAESEINQRMQQFEDMRQQEQQQFNSAQAKQGVIQSALNTLIRTGKGSSELYSLSPEERAEVESIASDIKRQRQQGVAREVITKIEA